MELKKSYKGFVLFLIGFLAALLLIAFLPQENEALIGRLICAEMTLGILLLAYIIYRTEYVYWYNGTEYEEAVAAGSERRKAFAWKHFRCFAIDAAVCMGYSLLAHLLRWPFWIDYIVHTVGLVVAAISTVKIKL